MSRRTMLALATGLSLSVAGPAHAQDSTAKLDSIEQQIRALQEELKRVKRQLAEKGRAAQSQAAPSQTGAAPTAIVPVIPQGYALVPAAPGSAPGSVTLAQVEPPPPPGPPLGKGQVRLGAVTVTLGGFIEAAGIYRTRNEIADIASNFNTGIPLPNSPQYHENEFRESARQTRISLLAAADPDPVTHIESYIETDFLGAAPTANSTESNSYNLRLRHAYLQYGRSDLDLDILAGQAWSLLTMDRTGVVARKENIPLTIDAQYVAGFTWARQPQLRVSKTFADNELTVAFSAENPQTSYYTGPNGLDPSSVGTVNITNAGGSNFAPTVNYSTEIAPDLIGKIAADPSFGHFEAYGIMRFEHDRVSHAAGTGGNFTEVAGGGGAAAFIPLLDDKLAFQASVLAGDGIGRYGTSQLPDAVVGRNGAPKPLAEVQALGGIVAHPVPSVSVYGYVGTEQVGRSNFVSGGKGYGYGSPIYSNTSCAVELGAAANCVANTSGVVEGTVGAWWQFLKGDFGTMQVGGEYEYVDRSIFAGKGPTPQTSENVFLVSFRYYPFQ